MATPRVTFENQLKYLGDSLVRMGSQTDEALGLAIRALVERDSALAREVIRNDKIINATRYEIEERSYLLLATQQPMARDLRRITAAISLATNMERMADHAAGIAVLALRLNQEPEIMRLGAIPRMAELGREMLRRSIEAYVRTDAPLAREIARDDTRINELYEQVLGELLTYMPQGEAAVRQGTFLLWVAHNLERWGDRVKNICERVVYVATGELADFDLHAGSADELDEHDTPAVSGRPAEKSAGD